MLCQAVLFHEQAGLKVEWLCRHPDNRLTAGALVSIRWLGRPVSRRAQSGSPAWSNWNGRRPA
jgi:hypothetical protein